jgi:AcrR family transcriptional regulator
MTVKTSAKDRILDAALTLFNTHGSANVTTNHIGHQLGMSPGNLYYHFRNKEQIIRALFDRLDRTWDQDYALAPDASLRLDDVMQLLHVTFETMWHYRFFYRETLGLIHNDPELAQAYRRVRTRGLQGTEELLRALIGRGFLQPSARAAVPELSVLIRIVTDNWLNFRALGDEPLDPTDMEAGVGLVLSIVKPYFSPSVQEAYHRSELARWEQEVYHNLTWQALTGTLPQENRA